VENENEMEIVVFEMEIVDESNNTFTIKISSKDDSTLIKFNPISRALHFLNEDGISGMLKSNEYQLRKMLHIKRPETYYKGFRLKFVLRDRKDVAAFNDMSQIIVVDKRDGKNESYVIDSGKENLTELYIDGSYSSKTGKGGFAVIIKSPEGKYDLKSFKSGVKKSSLLELLAAIKGLELVNDRKEVRIVTDSQYVRKGLAEWIINWKMNDWKTANGEKVKNIEYWKIFDKITDGKYVEFQYVKSHSGHFENTMADLYAKDMAMNTK